MGAGQGGRSVRRHPRPSGSELRVCKASSRSASLLLKSDGTRWHFGALDRSNARTWWAAIQPQSPACQAVAAMVLIGRIRAGSQSDPFFRATLYARISTQPPETRGLAVRKPAFPSGQIQARWRSGAFEALRLFIPRQTRG